MTVHKADIVIIGAGIAGLWLHHALRRQGYDVLLLENNVIGGGQSIAAQGIIHSGLKYAFGGKISKLAQSISAMPDLWRAALKGEGPVDLSAAKVNASSQYLLVPGGMMGGLVKLVAKKALGNAVREIPAKDWPESLGNSGFQGTLIYMDEPVLNVPSVLRALAEPHKKSIRKAGEMAAVKNEKLEIKSITVDGATIEARRYIFTSAGGNEEAAHQLGHHDGLQMQKRPLLMGMMKDAPFEAYAHLVGASDKPVATITTHTAGDGSLIWYLGGGVAERSKDSNPQEVYSAAQNAFAKYLPQIDLSGVKWSTLPVDRLEGRSTIQGFMPDTPTIHAVRNAIYAWPTKLTFAPMLLDMIAAKLAQDGIEPSGRSQDWSFLPDVSYANPPWDEAVWTSLQKGSSAIQG